MARTDDIRRFILDNVDRHPQDITRVVAGKFGITRQGAHKNVQKLVGENALAPEGNTRNRSYRLIPQVQWGHEYQIQPGLAEDVVWSQDIEPFLKSFPKNVIDIWRFSFTEMFNNAIDHSRGKKIYVSLNKNAANTQIYVMDDGVGIFKKIQTEKNLLDERHAILELAKGKLTTDKERHSGQGIFFTSRMVDDFDIHSHGFFFMHHTGAADDWMLERKEFMDGTAIMMKLSNSATRTDSEVFQEYSSWDKGDYGFTKTIVPLRLAQFGNDKLVSRSEAKRVLARVELFKTVILDFSDIESIGQAFADETFRVFANSHPEVRLIPVNANDAVMQMIKAAVAARVAEAIP